MAVGRLVKLSLVSSLTFVIDQGQRRKIMCHYGPGLVNAVAEAAGKYVEVRGVAQLDKEDEIEKFLEVRDLQVLEAGPTKVKTLVCEDGTVSFREALEFVPEYYKDLVILTNESLGIIASGYSAQECLANLAREFVALWDDIVQAPDDTLAPDAIQLKHRLRGAIEEVSR